MRASSSIASFRHSSARPTGTQSLCRFSGIFHSVSDYSEPCPLCCLAGASSARAAMQGPFLDPRFSARHRLGSKQHAVTGYKSMERQHMENTIDWSSTLNAEGMVPEGVIDHTEQLRSQEEQCKLGRTEGSNCFY